MTATRSVPAQPPAVMGSRRIACLLGIMAVFLLVGPPAGALVFMLTVALMGMGAQADLAGLTWVALFAMIYAMPLSYLIGAGPALLSGAVVGVRQAYFGRVTWLLALMIGLGVGVAVSVSTAQPVLPRTGSEDDPAFVPVMIVTCAAATMVCWLVIRGWYLPRGKVEA